MSSSLTIVQALVAIGVLVLVVSRRFAPRPVRGDRRRWTLPLILAAVGVVNLSHLSGQHPPVKITSGDVVFLVIGGGISLVLGLLRGATVRLSERDGQLFQRYSVVTAGLWIGTIAVRLGMDAFAPSFGVAKAVVSASLLLMFGVSLLGENLSVAVRTGDLGLSPQYTR